MVAVMCTPVIALGGTNIFYVDTANKKSLNMRSDCTMGDNIIASIPYRAEVTVYEFLAGDAWARVEYNPPRQRRQRRQWRRFVVLHGHFLQRLYSRVLHRDGQALQSLGLCQHALGPFQVHLRS